MGDTLTANGSQPTVSIQSKEQAKALHAELNKFYQKEKSSKRKPKPMLRPIGNTNTIEKKIVCQQNPIDWQDTPLGTTFALEPNAVVTYIKVSASKAFCLSTMSAVGVSGGSCYKVFGL